MIPADEARASNSFVVIWVMDKVKQRVLKIPAVVILFCCSFFCDWAFKAVLFTVFFALTYQAKQSLVIPFSSAFFVKFCLSLYEYQQAYSDWQTLWKSVNSILS